ncbi:hypothetical protein OGAPHI_002870 [Ogataea philodendri]|uniref:Uncharacterized protein n=1 Tax=Ogataea philodendri TaxID=1378263 RepID=A0A9P8T6S5_9ASCO|nr:uncharacterized protein OGAPHI_002870 [Ogataea philodendri]KAH3667221.1 hypothetical protein OGAPHI_002870 [Ogataea philodendri]
MKHRNPRSSSRVTRLLKCSLRNKADNNDVSVNPSSFAEFKVTSLGGHGGGGKSLKYLTFATKSCLDDGTVE